MLFPATNDTNKTQETMKMYPKLLLLVLCFCFLSTGQTQGEEAAETSPIEPTKVFASKKASLIIYSPENGGSVAHSFFPQEHPSKGNRIGLSLSYVSSDDNDPGNIVHFMYCSCKNPDNTYDVYSIIIPAAKSSHIFYTSYSITDGKLVLSDTLYGKERKRQYATYLYSPSKVEETVSTIEEQTGPNGEIARQRLRAIASLHKEGGHKKVKAILGKLLQDDLGNVTKEDVFTGLPETAIVDSKSTDAVSSEAKTKGMPITIQNNKHENIVSVGQRKVTVLKETDAYVHLAWMIELTNNLPEPIEHLSVEHRTISEDDFKLEDSIEIVKDLQPEETRKIRGTELIEKKLWVKAASHEFLID